MLFTIAEEFQNSCRLVEPMLRSGCSQSIGLVGCISGCAGQHTKIVELLKW